MAPKYSHKDMTTTCGKCSGTLTEEVYQRIQEYADMCVPRGSRGVTKDVNWAAHLQNMGLDLNQLAS